MAHSRRAPQLCDRQAGRQAGWRPPLWAAGPSAALAGQQRLLPLGAAAPLAGARRAGLRAGAFEEVGAAAGDTLRGRGGREQEGGASGGRLPRKQSSITRARQTRFAR